MYLYELASYSASNRELNILYKHTVLLNSTMSCCICMGSNNLMKVKCCNQQFHLTCLNQWLQEEKFTCPMCRNVENFMGSLPCMRQAINNGLDELFKYPYQVYYQGSEIFCGAVRISTNALRGIGRRPLRSNTSGGFFFDYKGSKIWIRVEYIPQTTNDPTYELTIAE